MAGDERGRDRGWRDHPALLALRAGLAAFQGEGLRLRAMALTYISVFSLLPALMVLAAVVRSFTDLEDVRRQLEGWLVANLAVGARGLITDYLDQYVFNAPVRSAGIVGFALLVIASVVLFAQVERAMNDIWAVKRQRPLLQRWLTYWAGLSIGPLLLAGSVALAASAQHWLGGSRLAGLAGEVLLSVALFAAAYVVVPATHVRIGPALAAGGTAGLAFHLSKDAYTWAVSHLFRFQALYGSLAAAFIFLLWLYVAWTIFLFGARLAFVLQHHRTLVDFRAPPAGATSRELLATQALLAVALAWWDGERPPDPGDVADRLDVPAEPVRDVLAQLCAAGLLAEEDHGGLTPARPLAAVTLADVRRMIAGPPPSFPEGEPGSRVAALLAGAEGAAMERLDATTVEDLCRSVRPSPPGDEPRPVGPLATGASTRIPV
jgi:membrane protein